MKQLITTNLDEDEVSELPQYELPQDVYFTCHIEKPETKQDVFNILCTGKYIKQLQEHLRFHPFEFKENE